MLENCFSVEKRTHKYASVIGIIEKKQRNKICTVRVEKESRWKIK